MKLSTVRTINAAIAEAIKPLEEQFGISFGAPSARYGENNMTVKIDVATVADDGSVLTKEAEDFKRCASMFGLKPEMLGRTFKRGELDEYEVTGLKPRSRKYPVLAKNLSNGKTYKFAAIIVRNYMGISA